MPAMYPQPPRFAKPLPATLLTFTVVAAFGAGMALLALPVQAQAQVQTQPVPQPREPMQAQLQAQAQAQAPAPAPSAPTADEPALVTAGEGAARNWLAKLDAGDYHATWDMAGAPFQKAITSADWEARIAPLRKSMGPMKERNVRDARFTRSMPGAPDGDYVLVQYDTRFENKAAAIETVTALRAADGAWRVVGYFIR